MMTLEEMYWPIGYDAVSLVLLLSILALILFWFYKRYLKIYTQFQIKFLLPDLLTNAFLGKIPKHLPASSFYFQVMCETVKKFQSEGICVLWLLRPYVFLYSGEAIKIFSNTNSALLKPADYNILRDMLGNSVSMRSGASWRQRRKMLNPLFNTLMLKDNVSVLNKNATVLVQDLQKIPKDASFDILKLLKLCAFSNICEAVLGLEINDPEKQDDIRLFLEQITTGTEMAIKRVINPWLRSKYALWFVSWGRLYLEKLPEVQQFTSNVLEEVKELVLRASGQTGNAPIKGSRTNRRSLAETLIEFHIKDPSYTMEDLQYEVNAFLLAGYNTVAYAMLWSLFLLGHHPEVQDRVYSELEQTMENDELSYENILKLTYLDCVVKETLRLYPSVPIYARGIEEDVQCGKYTVPKGTTVVFFPFMSHRDPKIYPDPEKFRPERFSDEHFDKGATYIPYSEGIRNCIGKKFAQMELKVVLGHIVKQFKVTSLDRIEDVDLNWEVLLAPVKPLQIRLTPRHQ